jgi:4-hydroxyphenylacetate 3-monooxygenase
MVKNGEMHISSLRDGRHIYLDGQLITDHVDHPAFRNAVRTAARLYDFQARPENRERMTFDSPKPGLRVGRMWQLPTSLEDLRERRLALEAWAELTCGMLGRSPDHVASVISGMYMGYQQFAAYDRRRADALRDYYEYARDRDLYLSYTIISPQVDRTRGPGETDSTDEFLACAVVDEDAQGITLRGAKMLGTATPLANELFVGAIQPLKPGEERYGVSAAVPLNAKGVKLLSRRSYEAAAQSVFDQPLAARFDENDCVVYFDDVRVPWERVFVYGSVKMAADQWYATPAHVYQNYQCQIRLMVKLRFLVGLARKIAEANGIIQFPPVRETLGQLAAQAAMVESFVVGMESAGVRHEQYWIPSARMLYGAQVLTQQLYPEFIRTIRELAGGALIMLPSSVADLESPTTRKLVTHVQRSPVSTPAERIKLMKLAWDALGSEFASRHVQYEMFYAGAPMVTRNHAFRTFDWDAAATLVDGLMSTYVTPVGTADAGNVSQ